MKPNITINDPSLGVLLRDLNVGDFFRFPTSTTGAAYVVVRSNMLDASTEYVKLDNGTTYSSLTHDGKRVVSAEFELFSAN